MSLAVYVRSCFGTCATNVHAWTFPDGFKTFKNLYVTGCICSFLFWHISCGTSLWVDRMELTIGLGWVDMSYGLERLDLKKTYILSMT